MKLNRAVYIILTAALLVLSTVYGVYLAALVLIIMILIPVISFLYCLYIIRGVELRADGIRQISEKGIGIPIKLIIKNKRLIPAVRVDVEMSTENHFDRIPSKTCIVTSLKSKEEKITGFDFSSAYCGKIDIAAEGIRVYDPFALICIKKRLELKLYTAVLPSIHRLNDLIEYKLTEQIEGDTFSQYKCGDDPSEIFDVRDYQDGDKYRRIHWKLSFKQEKLMVKELSSPIDDSVTIMVDLCVGDWLRCIELVDAVMEEVYSLSVYFLENDILHRICWYDSRRDELFTVKIQCESDMYEAMDRLLDTGVYRGKPMGVMSMNLKYKKLTHLFLFIPYLQADNAEELVLVSDKLTVYYVDRKACEDTVLSYFGQMVPIELPGARNS